MTQADKEELIEIIKAGLQQKEGSYKKESNSGDANKIVMSYISKGFYGVIMGLIFWIGTTVKGNTTLIEKVVIDNQYIRKDIEEIQEFTKKPRFTLDDFKSSIIPIREAVERNTAELLKRNTFMENTDHKIQELTSRVQSLEFKIDQQKLTK